MRALSEDSRATREVTDRYHLTERLTTAVSALPAKLAGGAVGYFQHFTGTLASALTVLVLAGVGGRGRAGGPRGDGQSLIESRPRWTSCGSAGQTTDGFLSS